MEIKINYMTKVTSKDTQKDLNGKVNNEVTS
jgi:hypothetical protein